MNDRLSRQAVHPKEDDVLARATGAPGLVVAVDSSLNIVLHTDTGDTFTLTNVRDFLSAVAFAWEERNAIENRRREGARQ